jgi:histidinol-phosphate phosphatase family protein
LADGRVPAVFLDRDGVINRRRPDHVKTWDEFEFLPGVLGALATLRSMNTPVVVVTNQGVVGRGLLAPEDLGRIHTRMLQTIRSAGGQVEAIYACLHAPGQGCACRKPAATLFHRASADLNIRLSDSIMVGDSPTDVAAARAAGCRPVLINDGGAASDPDVDAVKDLPGAVLLWRDLLTAVGAVSC